MLLTHLTTVLSVGALPKHCLQRFATHLFPLPASFKHPSLISFNRRSLLTVAATSRSSAHPSPPSRKHHRGSSKRRRTQSRRPQPPSFPLHDRRLILRNLTPMEIAASQAAMLLIQNMMVLCRQLRLPVSYKAHEWQQENDVSASPMQGGQSGTSPASEVERRRFSIVVHVHGDHAFKKYLQNFSSSDMLLYRGLLLQVDTTGDLSHILSARVQQAFLPKFENEGQDAAVAERVAEAAASHGRPTIITIKHSGSLVTLSYDGGWAAKNSVSNEFTAGGAALLRAHYERRHPNDPAAATASLDQLFKVMAARRLCLSFEMVTGSHGHHGQLPAAEYLVTTAAHTFDTATGAPAFLDWLPFLELCADLGLPTNDTWVVAGGYLACAARQALDALALRGGPTGHAVRTLDELVVAGAEAGEAAVGGCLRLAGTYPHDEWQGDRLEGFVVAAGQQLGPEEMQRLHSIRDALEAGRLPLAAVPEHLRRPYLYAVREAMATGAAVPGTNDSAKMVAAAGASDAIRAHMQAAAAAWMPHAALSYTSPGADVRDRVTELLASQPPEGLKNGKPYMELPEGRGRLYSRIALGKLGCRGLQELLEAELATTAAAVGGGSSERARELQEVVSEAEVAASDPPPSMLLVRAMRALAGYPEPSAILRYKKKMIMWSFDEVERRTAALAANGTCTAVAANGSSSSNGGNGGVVGYSLMTFVIRNGLPALRQGTTTYAAYVDNLVRRSWGLPKTLVTQVQHFARCWAAWVAARGGAAAVEESRYLEVAEPFVQEFLRQRGAMPLSGRSDSAFQGLLICVDTSEAFTQSLRRTIAPSLELSAAKLGDAAFSKGMVPGGAMLWLQPGSELPKKLRELLSSGAAPFTWVVAASASRPLGLNDNAPEAKRQKGLAQAKIIAVTAALGADGAASRVRHITLPAAEDDIDGAATARLAAEAATWLGRGTPLPAADPAVAAYFITIPGAGKSALTKGMTLLPTTPTAADGQPQQQRLTVKILNSDTMKKTVKNFNPNRYWLEVAAAADSCLGGGHVVVAVADKNLVPSPPGNIARALDPMKGTGVASLAIVPVVAGPSTRTAPAPAHADLYGDLPDLPFPLELVALCMMRTLKRRNHEGGLDGEKAPAAATVVAMFAGFYRHKPLSDLLANLRTHFTRVVELPVMLGDGVGVDADGGIGDGGGGGRVPVEVLRHVAEGVRDVSERAKPQLPAEWETRARELLLRADVVEALEALQLPMEDVRRRLEEEVASTLEEVKVNAAATAAAATSDGGSEGAAAAAAADGAEAMDIDDDGGAAAAEARVSYFSVEGLDDEALRSAAREVLVPELHAKLRRGSLHVTLWHRSDPELGHRTDLRRALMGLVGTPVDVEVLHIDVSPQVIAAHVRMLSADEAIPSKPYHHITLAVEKGHAAVESNQLPARLAAGEPGVERRPLPGGPLLLRGVVTAVGAEGGDPNLP